MRDKIEEKVSELLLEFLKNGKGWDNVAKAVLIAEVNSKIEGIKQARLENWKGVPKATKINELGFIAGAKSAIKNHQYWCDTEIKRLQSEIKLLEETEV